MMTTRHRFRAFTRRCAPLPSVLLLPAILCWALGCAGGVPHPRTVQHAAPPPVEDSVNELERAAYAEVVETAILESCDSYLERFLDGEHRLEVLVLREELRWRQVRAHPSFALCDLYLDEYPLGPHADAVRRLRHDLEWQTVAATGKVDPLRQWLREHPDSPHAAEARALWGEWRRAQAWADPSGEACALYLAEFPHSDRAGAVRARCAELAWSRIEESRDPEVVERWLADNRQAPQAARAERLLEELRFEEVRSRPSAALCRRYLAEYPQGRFVREVRSLLAQVLAWERVEDEDSVQAYATFAAEHPGHPRLAQARERSSVAYWRRRVERSPENGHSWTQLAEACLNEAACTLREIEAHYRRALQRDPDSAVALLGLATLCYNRGEYDAARELLGRSMALDDGIAGTHLYLGRLEARQENWRRAIEHLDRALELSPESEEALFHRAIAKLRIGGCRPALPDFRRLTAGAGEDRSKFVIQAESHLEVCTGGKR